ncbi:MAG: hypothetical protein NT023_17370, partial [Armatimonadetes bacterium]|nr:hypothetical protein [Armatimonadota bacterium]
MNGTRQKPSKLDEVFGVVVKVANRIDEIREFLLVERFRGIAFYLVGSGYRKIVFFGNYSGYLAGKRGFPLSRSCSAVNTDCPCLRRV